MSEDGDEYLLNNVKCDYKTKATPHEIAVKLFENLYGKVHTFKNIVFKTITIFIMINQLILMFHLIGVSSLFAFKKPVLAIF